MRSSRKLIGAIILIAALLLVTLPAAPALAAGEDIELDPEDGEIGDWIDIEGDDFIPSDYTTPPYVDSRVYIYFSSQEADEGDYIDDDVENYERVKTVTVNESERFNTTFKVPEELTNGEDDEDVVGGTYYVYVTYTNNKRIRAVAEFTVIAAEIEIDTDKGPVGTKVEINGIYFGDEEEITVEYDGDKVSIYSGAEETDDGEFTATIKIPASSAGKHTIKVIDDLDNEAEAEFTVEAEIEINPQKGTAGERFTVKGSGFGEDEDFIVEFGGDTIATHTTDSKGSFELRLDIPPKGSGTYVIKVEDDDGNKDSGQFTLEVNLALSETTGHVGSQITISGSGFVPNAPVTITYTSEPQVVATTTTDSSGKFQATFNVPRSTPGQHTISASDGTNTIATTFTMESVAPPIPAPLLPYDGVKAERPVTFDWEDVTDLSGITYTLQIASDKNFSNIVLEKTELETSGYTLTEAEKLEPTKKEAPYYWRLRAVDGATNESGWTAPGSFYVGFTFKFTGPILYASLGAGALILFVIAYMLGIRQGRMQSGGY